MAKNLPEKKLVNLYDIRSSGRVSPRGPGAGRAAAEVGVQAALPAVEAARQRVTAAAAVEGVPRRVVFLSFS